jgi:hypothetical protein
MIHALFHQFFRSRTFIVPYCGRDPDGSYEPLRQAGIDALFAGHFNLPSLIPALANSE